MTINTAPHPEDSDGQLPPPVRLRKAVWRSGSERRSFEWHENSMFLLPRHHFHQFSNTHGSLPARLLHYNYFPLLLSASPEPEAFISTSRGEAGDPVPAVDPTRTTSQPTRTLCRAPSTRTTSCTVCSGRDCVV